MAAGEGESAEVHVVKRVVGIGGGGTGAGLNPRWYAFFEAAQMINVPYASIRRLCCFGWVCIVSRSQESDYKKPA